MDRFEAARLAADTVKIISDGGYFLDGDFYDLRQHIDYSRAVTQYHEILPHLPLVERSQDWTLELSEESVLQASRRLKGMRETLGVLNFASARNPGGGFLNGARAQEESLARSSTLYASLKEMAVYPREREKNDRFCGNWAISSPEIVIFRDDYGLLLKDPYPVHVVTCAAPDLRAIGEITVEVASTLEEHLRFRIHLILALFCQHHVRHLVLGAWGCGVFGNDPELVAKLFHEALGGEFRGAFKHVTFAIYSNGFSENVNYKFFSDILVF